MQKSYQNPEISMGTLGYRFVTVLTMVQDTQIHLRCSQDSKNSIVLQYSHIANCYHEGKRYHIKYSGEKKRLEQRGDEGKESKASTATVLIHDFRHQVYLTIRTH